MPGMPTEKWKCKTNNIGYRKVRTQHDEISLWLTYSTYHNLAGKKQCLSITQQQYPSTIQQHYEK